MILLHWKLVFFLFFRFSLVFFFFCSVRIERNRIHWWTWTILEMAHDFYHFLMIIPQIFIELFVFVRFKFEIICETFRFGVLDNSVEIAFVPWITSIVDRIILHLNHSLLESFFTWIILYLKHSDPIEVDFLMNINR